MATFRFRLRVLPWLFGLLAAAPVAAEMSARELLPMASEYVAVNDGALSPSFRSGFFSGYVRSSFERGNGAAFCGPPCACDSAEAVAEYLEAHPEMLGRPARELVDAALVARFPCAR